MNYIQPADRNQYQMINCLEDLVRADHPVRVIDKIVESIILNNRKIFEKEKKTEAGRPAYDDSTMQKLYLYGYFNGISSSRKLETETYRNIEVIWLLGSLRPDHWTISNYRKENGEKIKSLTKLFRKFLRDNEYIKIKTVTIDGSKVKAYTNREMLTEEKIEEKLKGIDKKMEEYLSKVAESDKRDDIVDELEDKGDSEDKRKYLDKIIELQQKVEELQKQKQVLQGKNIKRISPSDPDARLMKSRDGKIPAYNVQTVVDAEYKMIADSEVVTDENDRQMLPKMVESIKEELGEVPEEVITDRGYNNPDKIEEIENKEKGIQIYASQEITSRDKEEIKFIYDAQTDQYKCTAGKRLVLISKNKKRRNSLANQYRGIECEGCQLRSQCTKSEKGRTIYRYLNQQWRDEYKKKMLSKSGKAKTAIRKTIAEHPFGTIKYLMGKIPLLLRGLKKVSTEINLYTTVYNLKRLINIEDFENLMEKIGKYEWRAA